MPLNSTQKAEICAKLDDGISGNRLAQEYNVAKSTISYIKKHRNDIKNTIASPYDIKKNMYEYNASKFPSGTESDNETESEGSSQSFDGSNLDEGNAIDERYLSTAEDSSGSDSTKSYDEPLSDDDKAQSVSGGETDSTEVVTTDNEIAPISSNNPTKIPYINTDEDSDNEDDPNKLCEKLQLLLTSNFTENFVRNEKMRKIISKLRDGGFID